MLSGLNNQEDLMKSSAGNYLRKYLKLSLVSLVLLLGAMGQSDLYALTVNVQGCDAGNNCSLPVGGFRWLVEEDNTTQSPPGVRVGNSISLDIHSSHAPVVQKGTGNGSATINGLSPAKRYYVSVLPDSGFSNSGGMAGANDTITVKVHQNPIPTAQVSVLVFKDHNPINNIFDQGEAGIADATVLIFDLGGQMSQDVFGNPLGTTYDAGGNVVTVGSGIIKTDVNGQAFIKNLAPGKYGIRAVPPGNTADYIQTSTIEGTPGIDAWVKANEPPLFIEGFGTGFYHAFIGFVKPAELPWAAGGPGGSSITGQNIFNHFGRPPVNQGFFEGPPVGECWVGLNDLAAVNKGLMAVPCDANSNFALSGVPAGTYQLVTWDKPLDALFGFNTVTVPAGGGAVNLGKVFSFRWFGTFEGSVFFDANQNGFRDAGEAGIMEQNINIRFRDGSVYQAQPTDISGEYSFSEVFPFFKWLVTEVDFARYKATGMTAAVDYGGAIPAENGWITPSFGRLNPQPQAAVNPNTGNNLSRTETGPVLTQAMQLYLNQTNVIDWGKAVYGPGENGGISGIVFYDVTRAENDPRYLAAEPWTPGIPRVQVCLYQDANNDGIIDDINGTAGIQLCDVDNFPFGWSDGSAARGPEDIVRSGDGTAFSMGDAGDLATTDSWDDSKPTGCIQDLPPIAGVQPCFDNFATWNQVRPGIFDGGYAFGPNLAAGTYIVEAIPPTGYELVKEEDKNVDFGDGFTPSPLLLPPVCVGTVTNGNALHTVPASLALFPGVAIDPPLAGSVTPLCNMKQVTVADAKNAAADFFLFTEVPKAARVVGFSNNDLSAEFKAGSPIFGEKTSPSWIPVSFQDWQGNEVARVYTDEWGSYNALLPSTYTMNVVIPTGVSPNMLTAVLNHPFLPGGGIDPFYDPRYSITPWTLDYWPGKTTYLDTPLIPVAAFTGFPQNGPDVEPADGTPVINAVNGTAIGPVVCSTPATLTVTSLGATQVLNPDFDPNIAGSQANITRDYGFGNTAGTITLNGTPLTQNLIWGASSISVTVPAGAATGQLMITRGDNDKSTLTGITLHVSTNSCANVKHVTSGGSIQAVIDSAGTVDGDLIIVDPGTYAENVILYKNVKLQGSGAGSTTIFANPSPAEKLTAWHAKITALLGNDPFLANEAPGIMVLGSTLTHLTNPSLIDGLYVFGSISGGGISVDDNAPGITISNNRLSGNQGAFGAGITMGMPNRGSNNPNVTIQYNFIVRNGGIQGGGGIALYEGSTGYTIAKNVIGGNFSRFNGGGIAHIGLSNNGMISNNRIIFNEVAFGGAAFGDGAGIYIGGLPAVGALGLGSGSVTIDSNLIQGNLAGIGSGAGIRASSVNGQDVVAAPGNPAAWYALTIVNNMIVNNVAGYAGGGIALQDVARATILNNTIANNDSTATAANAFQAGAVDSTPQAAGIVSNAHSSGPAGLAIPSGQTFSNPVLLNNIIWNNRSFYTTNGGAGGLLSNPAGLVWDLQVSGTSGQLSPDHCILTSLTPPDGKNYSGSGNIGSNPAFVNSYLNQLVTAAVIDEGGNFITVRFTPLVMTDGYHIRSTSPAVNAAGAGAPATDFDGEARPNGGISDIGADEMYAGTVPAGLVNGVGIFTGGVWYLDMNGNGAWNGTPADALYTFGAGLTGAVPVAGDWTGSGTMKIGVYTAGTWYVDLNGNGAWDGTPTDAMYTFNAGLPGAVPVTGDWTGSGTTKIGVYSAGLWYVDLNGNGAWDGTPTDSIYAFGGGVAGAVPVTGDWTGSGTTKIGVYTGGTWYVDLSGNGAWDGTPTDALYTFGAGVAGAIPVTGDWTGSGTTKIGVYTGGTWYVDLSGNGAWDGTPTDALYTFGAGVAGASPVTGRW
ncbi:MAG: hypothetical protein EPN25_10740 [Nitrospirae bacterium]|nr:MAG: hypothetical protein EPN25_10740 [Nitrospirota bacterium]